MKNKSKSMQIKTFTVALAGVFIELESVGTFWLIRFLNIETLVAAFGVVAHLCVNIARGFRTLAFIYVFAFAALIVFRKSNWTITANKSNTKDWIHSVETSTDTRLLWCRFVWCVFNLFACFLVRFELISWITFAHNLKITRSFTYLRAHVTKFTAQIHWKTRGISKHLFWIRLKDLVYLLSSGMTATSSFFTSLQQ